MKKKSTDTIPNGKFIHMLPMYSISKSTFCIWYAFKAYIIYAYGQLRPIVLLLVEFYSKFLLRLRFKFLHMRDLHVGKSLYPKLISPSDVIPKPKT